MARKTATKTEAPAPAATPAPAAPKSIKVLVENPPLRGSRLARWPLIVASKNVAELAALLKENGHRQTAAGTLRWLTKAKLVSLD
jgi:hypothetical protein